VSVFPHDQLPVTEVPRIRTRILCGPGQGAAQTAIWQQWLAAGSFIPLHYHEVEEVLLVTAGTLEVTLGEEMSLVTAPASIVVAAGQLHAMRPPSGATAELIAVFPTASPTILDADGNPRPMPWEDLDTREPVEE
jgi:quercetin dioxygenase-like cupin family protein